MPDAVFEGQEGKWITTKTGRHIFIPNNKSVKEVLQDVFEDYDWEDDPDWYDKDKGWRRSEFEHNYEFFVPEITDETEKKHKDKVIKSFKGILDASYAYIKNGFKRAIMKHPVYDMSMEDCIANMMIAKDQVRYMYLQDINVRLSNEDSYYNQYKRRLQLKYDGDSYSTLSNYYHESGHALDSEPGMKGEYLSYTYKDNEYGKSISELLKDEVTEDKLSIISQAILDNKANIDEKYKQWKSGDISRDEYRSFSRPKWNFSSSLGDVVHAALGFDKAMEATAEYGHKRGYYDNYIDEKYNHKYDSFEGDKRRGSEFFAEMVDSLVTDKHRQFAKVMEQIAPKACSVFYKIMEERYGYKRSK